MAIRHFAIAALFASIIVACESDDSADVSEQPTSEINTSDPIQSGPTLFGEVRHVQRDDYNQTDGGFAIVEDITAEQLTRDYFPDTDRCEVERRKNTVSLSDLYLNYKILGKDSDFVMSGENIVINSDAGTFATLDATAPLTGIILYGVHRAPGDSPGGLTVDIPGGTFPAFASVTIPVVPPPVVLTSSTDINPLTRFTWTPASSPRTLVEISLTDFGVDEDIYVECMVIDDGDFSFSESMQLEMGANFKDTYPYIQRISYNVERKDNAVLFTKSESLRTPRDNQ